MHPSAALLGAAKFKNALLPTSRTLILPPCPRNMEEADVRPCIPSRASPLNVFRLGYPFSNDIQTNQHSPLPPPLGIQTNQHTILLPRPLLPLLLIAARCNTTLLPFSHSTNLPFWQTSLPKHNCQGKSIDSVGLELQPCRLYPPPLTPHLLPF